MKTKLAKILGIGATLALLASLLITAIPAAAISQPTVSLDDYVISHTTKYTTIFSITKDLDAGDLIVIEFPSGTDLTNVTDDGLDVDVQVAATSGIGSPDYAATNAASTKSPDTTKGPTLKVEAPIFTGMGAMVAVYVSNVKNPDAAGDYSLKVSIVDGILGTTQEAVVTSTTYKIEIPTIQKAHE